MGCCASSAAPSVAVPKWIRPAGQIHKMTLAVADPAESAAFCIAYLQCTEREVPDPALSRRGIKWVCLPGQVGVAGELHFIPCNIDKDLELLGGVDLNNDGVVSGDELVTLTQQWFKNMVDQLDEDMKVWTVYCNTHCAWYVEDLTPVVLSLQKGGVPFFGPTLRADGVHQVAVPLTALAPHPIPVHLLGGNTQSLPPLCSIALCRSPCTSLRGDRLQRVQCSRLWRSRAALERCGWQRRQGTHATSSSILKGVKLVGQSL